EARWVKLGCLMWLNIFRLHEVRRQDAALHGPVILGLLDALWVQPESAVNLELTALRRQASARDHVLAEVHTHGAILRLVAQVRRVQRDVSLVIRVLFE